MQISTHKLIFAAGALALCGSIAQAAPFSFDTGLVEHHTFDTDVSDAFGRSAAAVGGATIDNGDSVLGGGSLAMDGTGYVDLGVKASLDGLAESTISMWFKVDAVAGTITQFFANDGWGASQLHIGYVNQAVDGDPTGSVYQVASPLLGVGDWQETSAPTHGSSVIGWTHVALVNNSDGSMAFYIDGVEVDNASAGALGSAFALGTDAQIGGWDATRLFTGNVDDFRIYDAALTGQQIAEIAALPEPGSLALLGLGGLLIARRRRA